AWKRKWDGAWKLALERRSAKLPRWGAYGRRSCLEIAGADRARTRRRSRAPACLAQDPRTARLSRGGGKAGAPRASDHVTVGSARRSARSLALEPLQAARDRG